MADLDTWPGREHREPSRSTPGWSLRRPLAQWLRDEGRNAAGKRVLDVGCGVKPYYPFFAQAASYVGVDVQENPHADLTGSAEALPVEDGSFDIVLCTQVLEHVDDPGRVVSELRRVTAPGGRVLASTHGVMLYHPNPQDLWRWTHTGLERLFRDGGFANVTVHPGAGSAEALAFLIGNYLHLLAKRAGAAMLARPAIALLNAAAAALDARVSLLRDPVPGALFANLHVVAVKE
ncbi:MAG TPA: class I SAM-dependent methyltransferase [Gaiellaceae bacterium]|nr:class I SAM-dependent methyltransferase [Gaiellaceae bacterium]